jgi:hypothetical protein
MYGTGGILFCISRHFVSSYIIPGKFQKRKKEKKKGKLRDDIKSARTMTDV